MRMTVYAALALNASLVLAPLGCPSPGAAESETREYECELRAPCDNVTASCILVQCVDDAGAKPPDTWYPDDSCRSAENLSAAAMCGAEYCCSEVGQ